MLMSLMSSTLGALSKVRERPLKLCELQLGAGGPHLILATQEAGISRTAV
jgi:hypothetical protein